jgi:hypothetical protein
MHESHLRMSHARKYLQRIEIRSHDPQIFFSIFANRVPSREIDERNNFKHELCTNARLETSRVRPPSIIEDDLKVTHRLKERVYGWFE